MTRCDVNKARRDKFADMFNRPPESFANGTSPDTLLDWDSLAHLKLMAALEERFDCVIPPEEQADMLTFELIGDILVERFAAAS